MFRQLPKFLLVGALAFVVDVAVMAVLIYVLSLGETQLMLIFCRIIAWGAAITVAYIVNARFTFAVAPGSARFAAYLLIQGLGGLINVGCYTLLILGPGESWPLVSLMIGSAVATLCNYLLVRRFVFQPQS
jgi:putative flippase GtrA